MLLLHFILVEDAKHLVDDLSLAHGSHILQCWPGWETSALPPFGWKESYQLTKSELSELPNVLTWE